jgi:hypothetical protein
MECICGVFLAIGKQFLGNSKKEEPLGLVGYYCP